MNIVEWAHVVLPLLALGCGVYLVFAYPEAIDAWVARLDVWWADNVGSRKT